MNHPISRVIQIKFFRWSSYVTIVVPVSFEAAIDCSYQNVTPNIKFPIIDKKAIFHIFLNNKASPAILQTLHQLLLKFCPIWVNSYTKTSIWILTGFDDPHIVRGRCFLSCLYLIVMPQNVIDDPNAALIDVVSNRYILKRILVFSTNKYKGTFWDRHRDFWIKVFWNGAADTHQCDCAWCYSVL